MANVPGGPNEGHVIGYLHVRLDQDETLEQLDESPVADTLERIPENMSGCAQGQ